jgi:hypothetical protein
MLHHEKPFSALQDCLLELQRLRASAADFKKACDDGERLLKGGLPCGAAPNRLRPAPQDETWRQRAKETREMAHRLTVAGAKRRLLEVAECYERLAE